MPLTPQGRISFPHLYTPTSMKPNETKKYSVNLFWRIEDMEDPDKALLVKMKEAAEQAAMERWNCALGEKPGGKGLVVKSPFKKGTDNPDWYEPDVVFVRFTTKRKPGVVGMDRNPLDADTEGELYGVYAGAWAHLSWTVFTYDEPTNRGVSFGFKNIQKTKDDEPLGAASTTPEDDFEVLQEVDSIANDDDIPF